MCKHQWEAGRIQGGFLFSPHFQGQIAHLCLQFQACREIKLSVVLLVSLCPVTTTGLFVSAFPCRQMLLCPLSGAGRAFEAVLSASRAAQREEVLRALNTGRCHLSASLKRYLANLFSRPKNRSTSCWCSRQPRCLPQEGEVHLGKLLPAGFVTLRGRWWPFCHACLPPLSPNTGNSELFFIEADLSCHLCNTGRALTRQTRLFYKAKG